MKEQDIALGKMNDWKKKFQWRLDGLQKEVADFKFKDRMSEAEAYVGQLEDISKKLQEANKEVQYKCYLCKLIV